MESKQSIGQRLIKTREHLSLTQEQVNISSGVSRSTISKLENDEMGKYLDLAMFYSRTYNISLDWLIDGVGGEDVVLKKETDATTEKEVQSKVISPDQAKADGVPVDAIPLYDIDINAGNAQRLIDDNNNVPLVGWLHLEEMPRTRGVVGVRAKGNSMAKLIDNGDIMLLRRLEGRSIIPFGEVFVIIGEEVSVVKYLRAGSSPGKWLLKSHNSEEHDDFEVNKADVKHLFVVTKVLKDLTY